MVHTWIIDLYHQQVQRGVRDIPYRRWSEAIAEWPPNLPRRADELDVLIGCVERRRITSSGIELFTLRYNCPELSLIRRALGEGEKAQLKYDPNDLSVIHVLDPARKLYVPVPALDQEYTRQLTLYQHEIIRRYARRAVSEHLDVAALCRARKRIEEIVARERVTQRRLTGRPQDGAFSQPRPAGLHAGAEGRSATGRGLPSAGDQRERPDSDDRVSSYGNAGLRRRGPSLTRQVGRQAGAQPTVYRNGKETADEF